MTDRFLIGSSALSFMDKPRDEDWYVINGTDEIKKSFHEHGKDLHLIPNGRFELQSVMSLELPKGVFSVSYQLDKKINPESPSDLCIFNHLDNIKAFFKDCTEKKGILVNPHIVEYRKNMTPKFRYHIFLLYCLMQNGDYGFTKKQTDIMQRIHDKEMPTDFSYDFLKKLEKWISSNFEYKNDRWYEKYVV